MKIQVAVVEDNAGICEQLQHLISKTPDLVCACVCRNAESALRRIPPLRPDVVVMDIQLPDGSGLDCTSHLKRLLPDCSILMFTINDDPEIIVKALEAGASGYILKGTDAASIGSAIVEVHHHGAPLSKEVARKLVETFRRRPTARHAQDEPLTQREEEVLLLLSKGLFYKEIADQLSIKHDTVGTHVKNIYRKLHVRTRTEAVMKYLR
jgi:DNA-binding NarL/FixJ family response regulator